MSLLKSTAETRAIQLLSTCSSAAIHPSQVANELLHMPVDSAVFLLEHLMKSILGYGIEMSHLSTKIPRKRGLGHPAEAPRSHSLLLYSLYQVLGGIGSGLFPMLIFVG